MPPHTCVSASDKIANAHQALVRVWNLEFLWSLVFGVWSFSVCIVGVEFFIGLWRRWRLTPRGVCRTVRLRDEPAPMLNGTTSMPCLDIAQVLNRNSHFS